MQCDASEYGLGATLLQDGQPVAFASRTLSPTERNYAQIENECLAIVFGCQRFDQYLARKDKITVESDHKPLQAIFLKPIHAAPCRLQRMLLRLLRYNLAVQYKKGSQMYLADHLSRAPIVERKEADELDEFQVFALEVENLNPFDAIKLSPGRLEQLQTCTAQDPVLLKLKTTVITGWPEVKEQVPIPIRDYWLYRDEISVQSAVQEPQSYHAKASERRNHVKDPLKSFGYRVLSEESKSCGILAGDEQSDQRNRVQLPCLCRIPST